MVGCVVVVLEVNVGEFKCMFVSLVVCGEGVV